jgi:actin-like ATPase involved in cell morphogenesis
MKEGDVSAIINIIRKHFGLLANCKATREAAIAIGRYYERKKQELHSVDVPDKGKAAKVRVG